MKVGYARIFNNDQDESVQLDALEHAGCRQIFTDRVSGSRKETVGLDSALDYMREGDVLVVWRLECLGWSLLNLVDTVNSLAERGFGLQSLRESIDTTARDGQYVFQAFAFLAAFQRDLIRERTQAGLKAARARGRKGGRPKKLDAEKTQLAYQLYDERICTVAEICSMLDISKTTLYTYLRKRET